MKGFVDEPVDAMGIQMTAELGVTDQKIEREADVGFKQFTRLA